MGKLSQEWEILQGSTKTEQGKTRPAYLWGASIIEISLNHMILLWEQRNQDVHGSTKPEAHQILLQRHRNTIKALFKLQPKTCPREEYIFNDLEGLVSNDNAQWLGHWIATRKPVIYASIKQAKQHAIENTPGIIQWFRPKDSTPRLSNWKRDHLRNDPFSKKKRQKSHSTGYQPTMKHFLSLHNSL